MVIKAVATVMIAAFMLVVGWFWTSSRKSGSGEITETDIGFGLMEVTYLLSLAAIWV